MVNKKLISITLSNGYLNPIYGDDKSGAVMPVMVIREDKVTGDQRVYAPALGHPGLVWSPLKERGEIYYVDCSLASEIIADLNYCDDNYTYDFIPADGSVEGYQRLMDRWYNN